MRHLKMTKCEPILSRSERMWFATVLAVLAIALLLLSCSSCAANQYPGEVPTQSDPAVAKLIMTKNGKEHGSCTVFKVPGTDLAMTAGHCCGLDEDEMPTIDDILSGNDTKTPVITYHAQGPHAVPGAAFEVLHDDDKHDVCTLRGKLHGAPIALALHDPPMGARVWTAGYPRGVFLISSGHWSGRDEDNESVASVAVIGGASGSPVMDDDGRVVGILRAYYPPMSNMAIISPLEWVRASYATSRR